MKDVHTHILERIVSAKRDEVAHGMRRTPLHDLKARIRDLPPPCDFEQTLREKECAIIAEVKRRSPSKGLLRLDFNHIEIASLYEQNGATAISILTDQLFFGGENTHLIDIREVTSLPLLRKDFIIAEYQIYETRCFGADALLLIASLFDAHMLKEYRLLAEFLGLSALVEIHTREELERALTAEARIIGINNRNLNTFSTDIRTSLRLAPLIPPDRHVVSESGITSREDIETLMRAGIHTFLIGEALMKSNNIGEKLRELSGMVRSER